ncbi:MAG TPA: 3-hydroxyacyl-CoA dehydrogenase NAD-binding domain-containing protein, partial [Vicinamibacterales bacterium]|nr:3-hydroxyacyl-CoA dehydrogenase NAD-binding domain-containing protein [Vicinamibacterales bacterium]
MSALTRDSLVAVVGAGAMGAGIAQVAAVAGHRVRLLDNRPDVAARAVAGIRAQLAKMAEKGRLTAADAAAAGMRLLPAHEIADLADAGLVIEAIVEDLAEKQELFADLEGTVGRDCTLCTNTSSISITAIGAALRHPERLAGLHFFNPAPLMALVEVVSGLATDRAVAETLFDTAAAWGKTPVHAKSTPGFIVNRVARPYYAEALRLVQEGAADCATIDAVMREAGGFRMGPFELMDMIGLDVNFAVTKSVWRGFFHDPRFQPSLLQQELVDAGRLGRKSGHGYYDYREGAARPAAASEPAQLVRILLARWDRTDLLTVLRQQIQGPAGVSGPDGPEMGTPAPVGELDEAALTGLLHQPDRLLEAGHRLRVLPVDAQQPPPGHESGAHLVAKPPALQQPAQGLDLLGRVRRVPQLPLGDKAVHLHRQAVPLGYQRVVRLEFESRLKLLLGPVEEAELQECVPPLGQDQEAQQPGEVPRLLVPLQRGELRLYS